MYLFQSLGLDTHNCGHILNFRLDHRRFWIGHTCTQLLPSLYNLIHFQRRETILMIPEDSKCQTQSDTKGKHVFIRCTARGLIIQHEKSMDTGLATCDS
jgi:hypothetical protein